METAQANTGNDAGAHPPSGGRRLSRRALVLGVSVLAAIVAVSAIVLSTVNRPSPTIDEARAQRPTAPADVARVDNGRAEPADSPPSAEYVVQEGDNLSDIAATWGTDLQTLLAMNRLENPDLLRVGQVLAVPAPGPVGPAEGPTGPSEDGPIYVVVAGDTILSIAEDLGVDPADLIAVNDLADPDLIIEGDHLRIPG